MREFLRWLGLPIRLVLGIVFGGIVAFAFTCAALIFPRDPNVHLRAKEFWVELFEFVWLGGE